MKIDRLKAPEKVQRAQLPGLYGLRMTYLCDLSMRGSVIDPDLTQPDLSQINSWPSGDEVVSVSLKTAGEGKASHAVKLPEGACRVQWQTPDRSGQTIVAEQ